MERSIDVNYRAVCVADEFELIDSSTITARTQERLANLDTSHSLRLLTPPIYYSLANGIADNRAINDCLLGAARRLATRAFGTAEPKFGETASAEIERLSTLGAAGLVWSPRAQGLFGDDALLADHIRHAASRGLISMVQAAPYSINEGIWRLWHLAEQCAGSPLVILGALESWETIQFVRQAKGGPSNVFYDLSAMSEGYDLDHLVAAMGCDRLLFGTGGGDGFEATLGVLERSALPAKSREAILWSNAAALFDLTGETA